MNLRPLLLLAFTLSCYSAFSQNHLSWGDQGNGKYKNPIISADYSDPDVIKAGGYFYMVCSDFHYMGMPVLRSRDMVNWTIVNQIYDSLPGYDRMDKYSEGSWAPSIRFHDHLFYVYFCTPNEGLFMSTAKDPEGKWSPLVHVVNIKGWEDPCPFWDADGKAYLGHSVLGAGPIILHEMSADGQHLLDDGKTIYHGPTSEGTKFYKCNGYYYLIIPEGGVATGYQTALRSKSIYGPYERKLVLEKGSTTINGPHQGALVEGKNGESWFLHFRDVGSLGRITYLEPVRWENDWPLMGIDYDSNGIGEPVEEYQMPTAITKGKRDTIQSSDEFNKNRLGFQWQWNHNPINNNWSLEQRKGFLALTAAKAEDNRHARNTLTQKAIGVKGVVTTKMMLDQMDDGQKAGISLVGQNIFEIGVVQTDGKRVLFANSNGTLRPGEPIEGNTVYLEIKIDLDSNKATLLYSVDGKEYKMLADDCVIANSNYWKGARPALFSYNVLRDGGTAYFDWFHYLHQ